MTLRVKTSFNSEITKKHASGELFHSIYTVCKRCTHWKNKLSKRITTTQ